MGQRFKSACTYTCVGTAGSSVIDRGALTPDTPPRISVYIVVRGLGPEC